MSPFFLNISFHQHNADLIDDLDEDSEATTYFHHMNPLQLHPLPSLSILATRMSTYDNEGHQGGEQSLRATIDTPVISGNKHKHLLCPRRGRATDWCCSPSPIGARRRTAFVPARPPCSPRSTQTQRETGPPRELQGPYTPEIVQRGSIRLQYANDFSGPGMIFTSFPRER